MSLYSVGLTLQPGSISGILLLCFGLSHVHQSAAMSELFLLKEKLVQDPLFLSLFTKANSIQEAIRVASHYGIHLSIEDVTAYRKELLAVIGKQSFHLDLARPKDSSWSWWGGGGEGGVAGGYGRSEYGGGGECSDYGGGGVCSD